MIADAPASPPDWPYCRLGDDPSPDGVRCFGRRVDGYAECLAHLSDADRGAYLAALRPGADVDHRGTPFTEELLGQLTDALTDPSTDEPRVGNAEFDRARFSGDAHFDGMRISGDLSMPEAVVAGHLWLYGTEVGGEARFDDAEVGGHAWFVNAKFAGDADFHRTRIDGDALFYGMVVSGDTTLVAAQVGGDTWFDGAQFDGRLWITASTFTGTCSLSAVRIGGNALFDSTVFEQTVQFGPLVCEGRLDVSGAVFQGVSTIEAVTGDLRFVRTRWASTAALRLRHAAVDLSDAVLEFPVSIAARSRPFVTDHGELDEPFPADAPVRVVSTRGVDAAHLVLTDVDLTDCLFAGTVHLDQLRLEGRCKLPTAPAGLRWTPRRTLAEEQHWRAARSGGTDGWTPAPEGETVLEPAVLAPVYRQLRKAFEDAKDEPGAADFYYGEMEMRRHDRGTPRAERALVAAYWALSGYGLRASRALGWLFAAMAATVLALMLWGVPKETPGPANPDGPYAERLTSERFEKSLRVVINSVVFRSAGQDLTTTGTYVEMTSRIAEPILLGLAVLAVRGRVKR
ncbi:Pentapeptide repeat-containing protein [Streptomyces sp. DI166]|uniref:pentapeptide repeat-containing protein n=1 Tax=Streptomyces sp. DI166 TaxID=1839783 RepID=UPI0007F5455F|nr:pentapeptide repeat-containing protein [Streptomyces sp. DI166]SBT92775.1 Pentapeptide repeat-containing protein [Streptomyces sp. DI166]